MSITPLVTAKFWSDNGEHVPNSAGNAPPVADKVWSDNKVHTPNSAVGSTRLVEDKVWSETPRNTYQTVCEQRISGRRQSPERQEGTYIKQTLWATHSGRRQEGTYTKQSVKRSRVTPSSEKSAIFKETLTRVCSVRKPYVRQSTVADRIHYGKHPIQLKNLNNTLNARSGQA